MELDDTAAVDLARTATLSPGQRADAAAELPAGLRLGHFRIDRKLGAGGMGEVYLATDLALDRPVAIKVLPATRTSGAARDRMVREARAQARVQHPNVAHIYFIGEEEGRLYFAMEYIAGKTLADRIAEGPLAVEDALATIRAAVLGLREAQRSGFTHRDVKPSNLMVDSHGIVKVVDFGLAAGAPEKAINGPVAQTTLAGTPLYMAPEQARGEPIDLRADIYALGATLYHLVSGRPPFEADSAEQLLTLHASAARPPVPRGSNPRTMIAAIDALISRMMAPRPEDRFASYDELLRAIEQASMQHTRPAGFWVRAIATSIDLSLITIVISIVAQLVGATTFPQGTIGIPLTMVLAIAAIARWGQTPGKALFELEVVDVATGRRPSWAAATKRELVMGVIPTLGMWTGFGLDLADLPAGIPRLVAALCVPLFALLLLYASVRTPGKRAAWDRIAGTQVRYRMARGS